MVNDLTIIDERKVQSSIEKFKHLKLSLERNKKKIEQIKNRNTWERLWANNVKDLSDAIGDLNENFVEFISASESLLHLCMINTSLSYAIVETIRDLSKDGDSKTKEFMSTLELACNKIIEKEILTQQTRAQVEELCKKIEGLEQQDKNAEILAQQTRAQVEELCKKIEFLDQQGNSTENKAAVSSKVACVAIMLNIVLGALFIWKGFI